MPIPLPQPAPITLDRGAKTAIIRGASDNLRLRLNFGKSCIVDGLQVLGADVLGPAGAGSGVKMDGKWVSSASLAHPPKISLAGDKLRITEIEFGGVSENWTFQVRGDTVRWTIQRRYLRAGEIEETAMPQFSFASLNTWTGALLGTGGVAWPKLFDQTNATYGVNTDSATFWNSAKDGCLQLSTTSKASKALRFTREMGDAFTLAAAISTDPRKPKYNLARFVGDRSDVWTPFHVAAGETVSATYELRALPKAEVRGRGDFRGLDTNGITELVDTIGRIGVIDEGKVGSNGWYSGYICMHEPWLARVGIAIDDPNYTRTCAEWLDYAREHAILPDGMVKSRWKYDAGDAQAGTYDPSNGFYEAQWGRLMDSQSSYVTNVADLYDQSGDLDWVRRQKASCEAALEYLLRRDADGNHLVEMANSLTSQRRSSDWLDIVWASHENAFVNAQLYGALRKWAAVERRLGDAAKASYYDDFAAKLKASFNKPISEGGFWNPAKGWYVYWRDADGSVHGDNFVVPVNLTAIADGICDDPARREQLLNEMERRMQAENLLSWPACFESYAPGEGANDKFPTYENGDIFLAWAEYGVRAYAATRPEIALKYVRQIVDRYRQDGLAFQRYLRADGRGAGDDILANNCNVITGLYQDIYGIQPKPNRLYLDPHLTPDLNGTIVRYNLRGRKLSLRLSVNDYAIESDKLSLHAKQAFGASFDARGMQFFSGAEETPTLSFTTAKGRSLAVNIEEWGARKLLALATNGRVTFTVSDLHSGANYKVLVAGKPIAKVSPEHPTLNITAKAGRPVPIELVPS